jgi:hypothetical protein
LQVIEVGGFSMWLEDRLSSELDFSGNGNEIWIGIFLGCSFLWI